MLHTDPGTSVALHPKELRCIWKGMYYIYGLSTQPDSRLQILFSCHSTPNVSKGVL